MVFSWIDYQRVDKLPQWADALGWLMTLSVILAIIVTGVVKIFMASGTFGEVRSNVLIMFLILLPLVNKH